jgi:RHS repeat-associated protein
MTRFSTGLPQTYTLHQNVMGSVVAVTDDSGRVVERYEYDAFGAVSVFDSAFVPRPASIIGNPYRFGGMEYDEESDLYLADLVHYHPGLGRSMQQDPTSLPGMAPDLRNGYAFAGNNPTAMRKGWDGKVKGSMYDDGENSPLVVAKTSCCKPRGWDGTIKGRVDDPGPTSRIRYKGWDGTIKGRVSDDGGQSLLQRHKHKGWDGTVKGPYSYEDPGSSARLKVKHKGWDGLIYRRGGEAARPGRGHVTLMKAYDDDDGDALARKHTKTGHVTLLKKYDNGSASARGKGHVTLLKAFDDDDGDALAGKHTKTGHVTLLKRYGDGSSAARGRGHVTLIKAYDDDDGDALARKHTKTGHVTLLKRYDDGSSAARSGGKRGTPSLSPVYDDDADGYIRTRTGYSAYQALAQEIQGATSTPRRGHTVTVIQIGSSEAALTRGKVKNVKDMGTSGFVGQERLVSGTGKKEFKGHVTLLK